MSSNRNPGKNKSTDGSLKGKNIVNVSSSDMDQLNRGVSDITVNPADDEGWEICGKKSKNKNKSNDSGARQWNSQNPTPKAWGQTNTLQKLGLGGQKSSGSSDYRKPAGRGHNKKPQGVSSGNGLSHRENLKGVQTVHSNTSKATEVDDDGDESEDIDDDTDEELMSDDLESDESPKTHEERKKHSYFVEMFTCLESLTIEQINDPERQWHCPACRGGPGAIDWYRGLQPVINHARTVRSKRVRLHRELVEVLEEELRRMGTSAAPPGEIYGKWQGLKERDREIVWPPMVVIMNTKHDKDDNDKWIGMGNQELLDHFSSYSVVKARHSYGPQGHRGMSVLIFAASPVGYAEAERLNRHFEDIGRDRLAWDKNRVAFYPGGKRQLYGYMAEKSDMELFNQHSQGKTRLKYEMRSYQEMFVQPMKQMGEDNQQLMWFKNKLSKEQKSKKALEETFGIVSEQLRKTKEETHAVKLQTKKHHEQTKEELEFTEQFFRDHMQEFYDARNAKEENFEKMQQDQRERVTQIETDVYSVEGSKSRAEDIEKFIQLQDKEMADFRKEREELMEAHEAKKMDMKKRHLEELKSLEKEFDLDLNKLFAKYTPPQS